MYTNQDVMTVRRAINLQKEKKWCIIERKGERKKGEKKRKEKKDTMTLLLDGKSTARIKCPN